MKIFKRLKDWSDSRGISNQEVSQNNWGLVSVALKVNYKVLKMCGTQGYVLNKLEELIEYSDAMKFCNTHEAIDAIADSTVFDTTELVKMGYDIEKVLDQTLKEIESRTGEWDDTIGKFQKYKTPEAMAKWVKADYSACRL